MPYLKKGDRILDLGSGTGHMAHSLMAKGFKVTCVDYENMNIFEDTKPVIYDGKRIPFGANRFDVVLLLTVLHHTPNPVEIIKEATRVGKRVIIMEDTYNSWLQKQATFVMDSIGNMQFKGHPHTNKNDKGWREVFSKLKLKINDVHKERMLTFFESTVYYLEK
jgi:2-polyprenyl-3-methyl-5-hydroxy-6-metoxy-1,4-benzoquinol methylase